MKLSTKATVFKRVSLLLGGPSMLLGGPGPPGLPLAPALCREEKKIPQISFTPCTISRVQGSMIHIPVSARGPHEMI